jgi:hypothetical protein
MLLHESTIISIILYVSSLGGHKLNHVHEKETAVTLQLIPVKNANFYWQTENSMSHCKTNVSTIAQTMWNSSITAVQLNENC